MHACYVAWAQEGRGMSPNRRVLTTPAVIRRDCLRWSSTAAPGNSYRLGDGHLPEFQPRVGLAEAMAWLTNNPNGIAWEVK